MDFAQFEMEWTYFRIVVPVKIFARISSDFSMPDLFKGRFFWEAKETNFFSVGPSSSILITMNEEHNSVCLTAKPYL